MKFAQPDGRHPTPASGTFSRNEKIKLGAMLLGVVLVLALILYGFSERDRRREEAQAELPSAPIAELEETAYVPDIDPARIDALVHDDLPEDRVLFESEAVDVALEYARRMTRASYEEILAADELDAAGIATLNEDPGAHRGTPFIVRGWIDSIRSRRLGPTADEQFVGRLILEDDSIAYFATLKKPERIIVGDFVRLDGLFVKLYSEESEENKGLWIEGPLIAGAQLETSFPSFGTVTELDPHMVAHVEDDSVERGIQKLPFNALWHVMAYARDVPEDAIDWDEVPELGRDLIGDLVKDGQPYRCQPFRFPVSSLQAKTILSGGENPARISAYTEGWIGNGTWRDVIHFKSPHAYPELTERVDLVEARGFFFKNLAYEPKSGGVHLAPVFIVHSMNEFVPGDEAGLHYFGYAIAALTVGLLVLFSLLLTKDRRRADQLQERLVQRRRARRGALPQNG